MREIKDRNSVKCDPNLIIGHPFFSSGPVFAMRMCVIPTKEGKVLVWFCCAPLKKSDLKKICEEKGLDLACPLIPTTAIKHPSGSSGYLPFQGKGGGSHRKRGLGIRKK